MDMALLPKALALAQSIQTSPRLAWFHTTGVRLIAQNTFLFEKLVNIVHADAPQAKFCFNTVPADTAVAVQRWFLAN